MITFVTLMHDDIKIMKSIGKYEDKNSRTPKKKEVIYCLNDDFRGKRAEKTFQKLVLLEVVEHKKNGHCWLNDKGRQALLNTR